VGGFSILIRAILSGATAYWIQKGQSLTEQIQKNSLSHLSLVSTQFTRLMDELKTSSLNISSLKFLLLGGSAMAAHHLEEGKNLGLPISKSYGMTEMASQIYTGKLLPYRELKIQEREICVRGPCLFSGYLRNNTLHLPLDREGWFHTNDSGEWHNDTLTVLGRKDRIFQSGGENISPEFIEKELLKINGIEKAYVMPEQDNEYGLRAVAYLETTLDLSAIDTLLKKNLSGLLRPKKYLPWENLPKKSWKLC
jgi:O-succinylbenzoic acid--CoA ligase